MRLYRLRPVILGPDRKDASCGRVDAPIDIRSRAGILDGLAIGLRSPGPVSRVSPLRIIAVRRYRGRDAVVGVGSWGGSSAVLERAAVVQVSRWGRLAAVIEGVWQAVGLGRGSAWRVSLPFDPLARSRRWTGAGSSAPRIRSRLAFFSDSCIWSVAFHVADIRWIRGMIRAVNSTRTTRLMCDTVLYSRRHGHAFVPILQAPLVVVGALRPRARANGRSRGRS